MNMRKIIAVLAAMLLLCAAIPMAAVSVAAADAVLSLDFEDGNAKLSNAVICDTQVGSGTKSIQLDCSTTNYAQVYTYLNLKANTDYVVNFKAFSTKTAGISVYLLNTSWSSIMKAPVTINNNNWAEYTVTVNPGDNTTVVFGLQSGWAATEGLMYYFDDITVIEKSAYKPSYDGGNAVLDKDFEDGNAFFSKAVISQEAANGSNSAALDCGTANYAQIYTYLNLTANTDYIVSFKAKASSNNLGISINFLNASWAGVMNKKVTLNTSWVEYTVLMNPGDNTTVVFGFQSGWSATEGLMCYFDDVIVSAVPEEPGVPVEPSFDGYVTNGDFETGDLTGYKDSYSGSIVTDIVHGGKYAHKSSNTASKYQGMMQQNPIAVKANTDYVVTFWYYYVGENATGSAASFYLYAQTTDNQTNIKSITNYPAAANTWYQVTLQFNSGDNTELALVWSNRMANDGGTYYFDDVKLAELSFDGYIYNGGFEADTAKWKTDSSASLVTDDVYEGNQALKLSNTGYYASAATQTVTVKANTVYELTWNSKRLSGTGAFNVILCQTVSPWANFTQVAGQNWMNETSGNWVSNSFTVNTGDNTQMLIKWTSERAGDAGEILIDNIKLVEVKDPSYDGYIYNGDFEIGKLGAWTNLWGSCPTAEVIEGGKDSDYALNVVSGKWKHVRQTGIAVEPNTGYKITAWAKNAKNMSLLVKDGGDAKDLKNVGVNAGDEWTEFTGYFNSGDYSTIIFSLMGGADEAYGIFDNISISLCEHEYDADCDADCNNCGATREASHSYFYPCDPVCQICYEVTNPDAAHSIVAVEAKDATCTENGNIAYWYCEHCGACWADEALTQVTNHLSVVVPTIEHSYDNIYDAACNVCGGVREVPQLPVEFGGKSISEDVSGLAFKYDLAIEGVAIKGNTYNQADFTNATFNGHKLLEVGVIASNGQSSTKIQGVHMCELEGGVASFVYRVVNIPADKLDAEITMTPYYVVEIDGVETTVYGEAMVGSYAEIAG